MAERIFDQLRVRAQASPGSAALLSPGRPALSHAALQRRSQAVARILLDAGVPRGGVVIVVEPDPVELLPLFLGITSFAACAPVNPALSRSELEFHLPDLHASAIIVRGRDSQAGLLGRVLSLKIFETAQFSEAELPPAPEPPPPDLDAEALLLHTSATTGHPKLVPLSHRRLQAMAANALHAFGLSAADRFLSMMPLFHLQGLISALAQLSAGGSVVCTPGFDAGRFPYWLEEFRPTWYTAGPALHAAILPVAKSNPDALRVAPLRFVRSIGARLSPHLLTELEQALNAPVLEGYGLTETGTVTSNPLPPGVRKPGSAGIVGGAELAILNPAGETLPPRAQGQIAVRGPAVFSGYRDNELATRQSFHDGWFLTGDLGWLDEDGYLFIDGRLKEMINRGGEKVLPGEIDDVLMAHPAVARAAAFALPHPTLGEDAAAAVVLRPGSEIAESDLRRFASAHLAPFKVPRRIFFVDALPVGATGKPKRAALSEQLAHRLPPHQPPTTPLELRLAQIWQRLLHVPRAGLADDFFALGGDSFAMTLLMVELHEEFGDAAARLDESEFFASPDIATLARLLGGSPPLPGSRPVAQRPPYVVLQREGSCQPFFCIPGADENPYYFRELAQSLGEDQPFYVIRDPQPLELRGRQTVEQVAARFLGYIRAVQPAGPYLLGGHCFGGIVAFEVARQLHAQGEIVSRLVLFEVPTPGYPKLLRTWKGYGRVAADLLRGRRRIGPRDAMAHVRVLSGLARRKARDAGMRLFRLARPRSSGKLPLEPEHPNVWAARVYTPQPHHGRVTCFLAADEPHSTQILDNPLLAWREFVHGEFEVRHTPGRAAAIFRHPHVRHLAGQLRRVLDPPAK